MTQAVTLQRARGDWQKTTVALAGTVSEFSSMYRFFSLTWKSVWTDVLSKGSSTSAQLYFRQYFKYRSRFAYDKILYRLLLFTATLNHLKSWLGKAAEGLNIPGTRSGTVHPIEAKALLIRVLTHSRGKFNKTTICPWMLRAFICGQLKFKKTKPKQQQKIPINHFSCSFHLCRALQQRFLGLQNFI